MRSNIEGDRRSAWGHGLILLVCLFAACAWAREERTTLAYGSGKSLLHPRVLERTANSARIVHDVGVGAFYKHEFSAEDWRWVQGCEIGSFQRRGKPEVAQAPVEPNALGLVGKHVLEGLAGTRAGWFCAAGFLFAVLCRLLLVKPLVRFLGRREHVVGPAAGMLAAVEQIVYTGALVGGWAWFVAAWMVTRMVAERDLWLKHANEEESGRRMRLYFLETGLSLLVAAVGARVACGDATGSVTAWVVPLATLAGFVVLFLWVRFGMHRAGDKP